MRKRIYTIIILCLNLTIYSQTKLSDIDTIKNDSLALRLLEKLVKNEKLSINEKLTINLSLVSRTTLLQQFKKAITIGNKSVFLAQTNQLDSMEASFYKALGVTNYYMEQRSKAADYFKKALDISHKNNYWLLEATCSNNLGAVLIDMNKLENTDVYLLNSIAIMKAHKLENDRAVLNTYRILATYYVRIKRFNKAEPIFLDLIIKSKQIKDTALLCDNLLFYSELLRVNGDSLKAVSFSEEALKYMRNRNNFHGLIAGLLFHSKNLATVGRDKEAYKLEVEAYVLQKKTFEKNLEKAVSEVEVKYKTAQIQQEKELAEVKAKKKQQIYLFSFICLFVILILLFFFFNSRKNTKQKIAFHQQRLESLIEGEEKERSRIAKDLHDGIVQDLTAIKLKVQSQEKENIFLNEISIEIDKATKEVRDIAYQMMPVSLREYGLITSLQDLLQKTLSQNNLHFDFETVNIEKRLPEKIEVCLYRITQELINNTLKHSKANFVSLVISKHQDNITLIFEDNRIGFDQIQIKKGIGMNSLASRLEIVNGELKFQTSIGTGTMAIIKIPLNIQ